MNWIDLIILLVVLFYALDSLYRSFLSEISDLFSFIFAFVFSLRFYNSVAKLLQDNLSLPHSISTVLGFILVWFFVETFLLLALNLFLSRINLPSWMKSLNFLSIFPAIFKALILVSIILIFIASFPIQPRIKKAVDQSILGSFIVSKSQSMEEPLKRIFGGISQDTLTFLTIKPDTTEIINLGFNNSNFFPNEELEKKMANLVNQERQAKGLSLLAFDEKLREVARSHSSDMFLRGYFAHYSPEGKSVADRAEESGVSYLVIGENLAYAPNLNLAHSGLMNSPGHRANILSEDFAKIGIGVMDGSEYGLMITQVFSN